MNSTNRKQKILLVDDHPLLRHGLVGLIDQQPDMEVCGEADSASAAIELANKLRPDAAIVDLGLKKSMGLELIKDLRVQHPRLPILVLSMHDEALYTERVLRAGARGYIMKDEPGEEILAAIRRILGGKIYLSNNMGTKLLSPMMPGAPKIGQSPIDKLSDRELEVFQMLGKAYETRQIAETLRVSVKTVESYREHIKVKLNLDNSIQLIRRAVEWVQSSGIG